MIRKDYVIEDRTNVAWPGRLPYRSRSSRRGYASRQEAERRIGVIQRHYARTTGQAPGDLRVVERRTDEE